LLSLPLILLESSSCLSSSSSTFSPSVDLCAFFQGRLLPSQMLHQLNLHHHYTRLFHASNSSNSENISFVGNSFSTNFTENAVKKSPFLRSYNSYPGGISISHENTWNSIIVEFVLILLGYVCKAQRSIYFELVQIRLCSISTLIWGCSYLKTDFELTFLTSIAA